MLNSSNVSKEMLNLVKSIGEARSKQEEDKIILTESAELQIKFKEMNLSNLNLKDLLIRSIYIQMLGHDNSFSHIHAVTLT